MKYLRWNMYVFKIQCSLYTKLKNLYLQRGWIHCEIISQWLFFVQKWSKRSIIYYFAFKKRAPFINFIKTDIPKLCLFLII